MVDVAHHRDHRRPRLQQRLVVVVAVVEQRLQLDLLLLAGVDQQQIDAELERVELHVLVGQRHRHREHLAVLQQELDDVAGRAVQLGTELLGRHTALDDDRALGYWRVGRGVALLLRLQLVAIATTTPLAPSGWAALSAGTTTTGATGDCTVTQVCALA